jgi:DNA/RNA endonuclease YhcR with UshA esterase domain
MNSLFSISKTEVRFRKKILIAKTIISPLTGKEYNLHNLHKEDNVCSYAVEPG